MSSPAPGKRPLSHIAQEAEANGRFNKRRPPPKRAAAALAPPVAVAAGGAIAALPTASSLPSPYRRDQTVFRILCPASKTGSIIGKSGSIIKSIREETGATIRIEDGVMGCDERVVTISAKEEGFRPQKFRGPGNYRRGSGKSGDGDDEDEDKADYLSESEEEGKGESGDGVEKPMAVESGTGEEDGADGAEDAKKGTPGKLETKEPGLALVQEALLRVHLRIMETDPSKPEGSVAEQGSPDRVTRLLVPTTQVGCLLGKRGKIITQIRQDSGAQIRVLPREQLPLCATPSDEVVQITGNVSAIKKALLAVSTQLRNNPPKKQNEEPALPPSKMAAAAAPHSLDLFSKNNTFLSGNMMGTNASFGMPISPRLPMGQSPGLPLPLEKEEVTFRILCVKDKIGSIIGKGGSIVQSIREETGAKISIDVSSDAGDLRVVRITAHESPGDTFSKAQKAVMIIHTRLLAADAEKDGQVTIKLLVPADQAGCLLGRAGYIMIEMRKLTHAKIHIHGREQLPPCAQQNDEIVEIIGNFLATQEALIQVTTRLRNNLFNAKFGSAYAEAKAPPPPLSTLSSQSEAPFYSRSQILPMTSSYDRYLPYSDITSGGKGQQALGSWSSQVQTYGQDLRAPAFNDLGGMGYKRDYALEKTRSSSTFISSQTVEVIVPEHAIGSIVGESGTNLQQICKISGARVKLRGLTPGALERSVEISGTPDQTHAAQSLLQAFVLSGQ